MTTDDSLLRDQLVEFLRGGSAHLEVATVIDDFPEDLYGSKPVGAPYTPWQLLEHMRIALNDLLVFSTDPNYVAPKWPDDYWPSSDAPANKEEWKSSVNAFEADLGEFERLARNPDSNLHAKIPWGEGQTLLHEIMLASDHNSYHLGQLVLLKKQLGA